MFCNMFHITFKTVINILNGRDWTTCSVRLTPLKHLDFFVVFIEGNETEAQKTEFAVWIKHIKNKYGKIIPMPSNLESRLLVKISSSQYGPACPPVIIKEKDGSRGAQQRHQHASLLCSERSTFSNPPAPDGPIYCTKWIVFGCTLYFQIFFWYPLSFSLPHPLSVPGSVQLMESAELSGHFMDGVLKGSAGSDESDTLCQADATHSSCKTYKLFPLWLNVFVSLLKKKKKGEQNNIYLQAAPQAFPWGSNETR